MHSIMIAKVPANCNACPFFRKDVLQNGWSRTCTVIEYNERCKHDSAVDECGVPWGMLYGSRFVAGMSDKKACQNIRFKDCPIDLYGEP